MKTIQQNKTSTARQTVANRYLQTCRKLLAGIEQARNKIINEFRETVGAQEELFELATKEAEALAWQTDYPHLVFPSLAVEKIQAAARQARQVRQQSLQRHHSVSTAAA
jgi:hypothetical protein